LIREVEGLRGIRTLIVLGAVVAAAYVVHRVRSRRWKPVPLPVPDSGSMFSSAQFEPAPYATEPPAETVAMVAPVEGIPPTAVARSDSNGSATPVPGPGLSPTRTSTLGPLELPPKRRPSAAALITLAALVGVAAIALGATALVSSLDSDDSSVAAEQTTAAVSDAEQAISLLANPTTKRMPIANSGGRIILALGANGRGVLILDGLGPAPAGKAYQAWVIKPNAKAPSSAAVFAGAETMVPLSVSIKPGAVVAITIEQSGGVSAPTQTPKLVAQPVT